MKPSCCFFGFFLVSGVGCGGVGVGGVGGRGDGGGGVGVVV
jgi:hypothetical protein